MEDTEDLEDMEDMDHGDLIKSIFGVRKSKTSLAMLKHYYSHR